MKLNTLRATGTGLAVAASLALAACGGSSDSDELAATPEAADAVPASAMASTESFVAYQQGLATNDTIESLSLQQLMPPQDDTAEPTPIGG